ncbi:MAG: hypothetical protein U0R28_06710 [Candidatus Nanopelagicales bacterium]
MSEYERMRAAGGIAHGPEEAGPWYQWGPYLSERAWGTVREDYSADGDAWNYFPFDHAHARVFRWSEDGLAGLSDLLQDTCFAVALWNGKDRILKERLFGLASGQGNHGEDVKEYYWYRDATPSQAWLRWRYHYPQAEFPYDDLIQTNAQRDRTEREFELIDTGVFDDDRYWVVDVDYAKATPTDISIRITITNAGPDEATLDVLPSLWFRNTWGWGRGHPVPEIRLDSGALIATHWRSGTYHLDPGPLPDGSLPKPLLCNNETNQELLFGQESLTRFPKDGIDRHVRLGEDSVNPENRGTKSAWWYRLTVPAGETREIRLRLWKSPENKRNPEAFGKDFEELFTTRLAEADEYYSDLAPDNCPAEEFKAMRMAFAGMIWSKQFYRYDIQRWLAGDPGEPPPPPPETRRNHTWQHVDAYDVVSMPDAWEYPWFAAWDLAFHTVVFTHIDPSYAKYQLLLMCREWYMHPNGALPAYEWNFNDINPPVHAWAALRVFEIDGSQDHPFLEEVFQKLLMNFTWWVNRVDAEGNNVFQGGFLGLDNIGPINRSQLPEGCRLAQADGTAWMAFYCLTMLRIALRLAEHNEVYDAMALKFAEHFAAITDGMAASGMWDWQEGFFYDQLLRPDGTQEPLRVRSVVGLIPILAAAWIETDRALERNARLYERFADFLRRRGLDTIDSGRAGFVYRSPEQHKLLLTVLDPERLRRVMLEVLSEDSFLSPHGLRSLSRRHKDAPFSVAIDGQTFQVDYEPAESATAMYGGNSNWRGPVWFPINHLIIEALERYYMYLGDSFQVECPTGSGEMANMQEVAEELRHRLISVFLPDAEGRRPVFGDTEKFQTDPRWSFAPLFYEYFHGDNGAGLGASHQTGWTGLVADLIIGRVG